MPTLSWRTASVLSLFIAYPSLDPSSSRTAAPTTTTAQNNWRRVDTPNFVTIGDVSSSNLRDLAGKFEGFRETLSRLHGASLVASAVPTVIVVFPTDYAMEPFLPKYNGKPVAAAGLFMPGRDVNFITMVDDNNPERLRVIFHEFTHLAGRNSSRRLPTWLSEGFAEYYSTYEPLKGGREAVIGKLVDDHILRLNGTVLMPIAELIAIDHHSPLYNEGSRRGVFYAQSWALVHMILRAQPSRSEQLSAYVDRVWRGEEPVAAWRAAFAGVNMDQELDRYIRQESFRAVRYTFDEAAAKSNPTVTPMAPSDVQSFLADLHVQLGDVDAATKRLADLAKRDPASARASVSAARVSLDRGKTDEIGDRIRTMTAPSDWYLSYMAGVTLADQIRRSGSAVAADVQAVERLLAPAHSNGRVFPHAVASVAALELQTATVPSADIEASLERVRKLVPGRMDYAFLHAQILVRRKELPKARSVLDAILVLGSQAERETARRMMGLVADYEKALAGGGGAPPPNLPSIPSVTTTPPPSAPKIRPIFRVTKPDEQRLEATIERVECVVGKGITFHFTNGEQTITANAMKFDEVEFITYRDDLTGSISCGPWKEPMRVYLTWRPGKPEGTKIAVAIEFLPRYFPL